MIILGLETSCDETAAAVVTNSGNRIAILSNVVASSSTIQAKYGGVIPEQAAREQLKFIIPVTEQAIYDSRCTIDDLDAIAITQGPGLIGSLLVGVETAKTLSLIWDKPLIPINHLLGHFYANYIEQTPIFPAIGLLVSGGHTDLIYLKNHNEYEYLGGTRDDAAGECFDKCARLLGLGYPGGPLISKLAEKGDPAAFKLPRPMLDSKDLDFSFSGLKTAVSNIVNDLRSTIHDPQVIADLCASLQQAIVDTLVKKTIKASQAKAVEYIIVAGGVAANACLRENLPKLFHGRISFPPPELCTDNGVMIAITGFYSQPIANVLELQANPNLSLS